MSTTPSAEPGSASTAEAGAAAAAPGRGPARGGPTRGGARSKPRFGVIGAGSFATATIIPGLLTAGLGPVAVASAGGLSAEDARRRFGFEAAYSDPADLIGRGDIDLVVVATRHDSHAELTAAALEANIATYVEKPLALDYDGLARVRDAQAASGAALLVGFNRRYAPLARRLRDELSGPKLMRFRVNAGRLPAGHWTNDPAIGGGRLLGEGCHFIDFLCDQAEADPLRVLATGFPSIEGLPLAATDNFSARIEFADGSVGTVDYAADAPTGPGKERFEVSAPDVFAEIDDFRRGELWRGTSSTRLGGRRREKGWSQQYEALAATLRGEAEAEPPDSFLISSLATLAAARSLQSGLPETISSAE